MRRLGYNKNIIIKENDINKIEKVINLGFSYAEKKGAFTRLKILAKENDKVEIENNITWQRHSISKFLKDSSELFLIGVTVGKAIIDYRDKLMKEDGLFTSVIIDATASETVESLAEWLHQYLASLIQKQGLKVTKNRFSPGYGDMDLSNQKSIFDVLELNKIGIFLSSNFIMNPEKSITAIIGIII